MAKPQDVHPLPSAAEGDQAIRLLTPRPWSKVGTSSHLQCLHLHEPTPTSQTPFWGRGPCLFSRRGNQNSEREGIAQGRTAAVWAFMGLSLQVTKGVPQACLSDLTLGYELWSPVWMFLHRWNSSRRMYLFLARTYYQWLETQILLKRP